MACMVVMLVACASFNKKNVGEINTTSEAIVENPALSRVDTFVVATDSVKGNFNPLLSSTTAQKWVKMLVFEGLYKVDAATGELIDQLAILPEVSEDRLTYTITLKDDIKFQDGHPLTSKDIIFTYNIILSEAYQGEYQRFKAVIREIVAIDQQTVQLTLNKWEHENLELFAIPILSESYYQFPSWNVFVNDMKAPMGTGPMRFDAYVENEKIVLKTNPYYWGKSAQISGVEILEMNLDEARSAFEQGQIDLLELPRKKAIVNEMKKLDYANIITEKSAVNIFIGMDHSNPLFKEAYIRKALIYGLNREEFIISEFGGYAETIPFIASCPEEYAMSTLPADTYAYSEERAIQLLEDYGWKDTTGDGVRERNGETLSFEWYVFADSQWSYNLAVYAAESWKKLGFDVKLVFGDYETMTATLESGKRYSMWNMGWLMSYGHNPSHLFGSPEISKNSNYSGYVNLDAEALFVKIDDASSQAERDAYYAKWHEIQNSDVPYLPIARLKTIWAYNDHVANINTNHLSLWPESITLIEIEGQND